MATFLCNLSPIHLAAADQTISYLYRTRTYAIEYSAPVSGQQIFLCISDTVYADDPETYKSTEGFLYTLFGGLADWHSMKQKTVTTSSTEAELLALLYTSKETI